MIKTWYFLSIHTIIMLRYYKNTISLERYFMFKLGLNHNIAFPQKFLFINWPNLPIKFGGLQIGSPAYSSSQKFRFLLTSLCLKSSYFLSGKSKLCIFAYHKEPISERLQKNITLSLAQNQGSNFWQKIRPESKSKDSDQNLVCSEFQWYEKISKNLTHGKKEVTYLRTVKEF